MNTPTIAVPSETSARSTSRVLEGARELARRADLRPESIRRRYRVIGTVALIGALATTCMAALVLFAGTPPQGPVRLLVGFVGIFGLVLVAAAIFAAGVLLWNVSRYQHLRLLKLDEAVAEGTERIERQRQRITAFLATAEGATPDTLKREIIALRRDIEAMDDRGRIDQGGR